MGGVAQERHAGDVGPGIEWFESLSAEEQSTILRLLSHFCVQARATTEDGPESIRRSGLSTAGVWVARPQERAVLAKDALAQK
ncbi:DUF5958 family protein [Streptomyces sp. NPDC017941]|uniref:DUF5958 family protein n=1 Tax=unclassified Streptomyces TaxID=2593676 RepID=UPI00378AE4A8